MRVVVPGAGAGAGGSYWGVSGAKEGWQVDPRLARRPVCL